MKAEKAIYSYLEQVSEVIRGMDPGQIGRLVDILISARNGGQRVFLLGNGGSAATASHWACDLNKAASIGRKKRFRAICLNDNVPTMMAYANDIGYDVIFMEPLKNMLMKGDVVIGISGSGNSPNVLKAIEYANQRGARTVGVCGFDGGRLADIAETVVHVKINDMMQAEDAHMVIEHVVTRMLSNIK